MVNKAVSHYRIIGKPRDLISDGQGQMGFNSGAAHRFKRPGMLGGGSRAYSRIAITAVQLLVFLMHGCVVPVPYPRKIKGPDLHTIQVGLTTRDGLEQILGPGDNNRLAPDARLFWARWEEDRPIRWIGAPHIDDQSSKIVNVLASFDTNGILTDYRVCSEGKLIQCLYYFAARSPSKPGISAPLTFEARRSMWWTSASSGNERFWGNITFDKSKISLRGTSDKISLNFDVGWDQIDRLRVRYGSSAEKLHLTVHLKPVSYRIDYVDIYASPRDTWNLIGALMSGNPKHK